MQRKGTDCISKCVTLLIATVVFSSYHCRFPNTIQHCNLVSIGKCLINLSSFAIYF